MNVQSWTLVHIFSEVKPKMNFFSESIARLKYELRVSKDGEVATALGLSKTAFAERKRRGAFPEKELYALAEKRSELRLDVLYILTGERREGLDAAGAAMFEAMAKGRADDADFLASVGKNVENAKKHIRRRLPMYRQLAALLDLCSDTDVLLLTYLADRMRHGVKPTFPHHFEVDWKTGGGGSARHDAKQVLTSSPP
jgi:hypothetical protein